MIQLFFLNNWYQTSMNNFLPTAHPQCCSVRFNLAVLMFFGFAVVYALRVNFSVAMVAMANSTDPRPAPNSSVVHACPLPSGMDNTSDTFEQPEGVREMWMSPKVHFSSVCFEHIHNKERLCSHSITIILNHLWLCVLSSQIPQYLWDSETQGWLLGAFFFGYLCTQVPGGYLSGHYGGSVFLGVGVLGTAILTMLTPLAAQLGSYWLFTLRALEGFGEVGVCWTPGCVSGHAVSITNRKTNVIDGQTLPLSPAHPSAHLTASLHLPGCDIPSHDGNVGSVGSSHGALPPDDPVRFRVKFRGLSGPAAHRLHLPDLRLARCLLHLWWGRRNTHKLKHRHHEGHLV